MKQTAYFSFHFIIYLAMAIMLIPNKVSSNSICKQPTKKVEIKVASVENKEEDLKNELLFRY